MIDESIMEKIQEKITHFDTWIEKAGLQKKDYQKEGLRWMLQREMMEEDTKTEFIRGGILADEMGLGKTIQILGLLYTNFLPKTLIVVPLALLNQWSEEIYRLLGHRVCIYYGEKKDIEQVKKAPVVLTTYGHITMKKLKKKMYLEPELAEIKWNRVVYDEGHKLRNRTNRTTQGAQSLKTEVTWIITGTPIQNQKRDLYSLCEVLGFSRKYSRNAENLQNICEDYILQRRKEDVGLTMPELRRHTITVEWECSKERQLSEAIHRKLWGQCQNEEDIGDRGDMDGSEYGGECGGEYEDGIERKKETKIEHFLTNTILSALTRARQSCILPSLMTTQIQKHIVSGKLKKSELERLRYVVEALKSTSKIDAVVKTIRTRKENGRAKIVFCHYTQEIDCLFERLTSRYGFRCGKIDGRTTRKQRKETIHNKDLDVLILQIQSCAEGLNLQHYNEIYFVSPHWNPFVEDQAVARAYRLGQTQDVDVFRFEMAGFETRRHEEILTIEQYCMLVQERKRSISYEILQHANHRQRPHSLDCLKQMMVTSEELENMENKTCAICIEECWCANGGVGDNGGVEDIVIKTHCGHIYHKKCAKEWLNYSKKSSVIHNCPMCRSILTSVDYAGICV